MSTITANSHPNECVYECAQTVGIWWLDRLQCREKGGRGMRGETKFWWGAVLAVKHEWPFRDLKTVLCHKHTHTTLWLMFASLTHRHSLCASCLPHCSLHPPHWDVLTYGIFAGMKITHTGSSFIKTRLFLVGRCTNVPHSLFYSLVDPIFKGPRDWCTP